MVLSAVACVLAVAWLGNAALTIWLREPAAPATLPALLALGLVLYATWHFAKAAFFRPESPFEWSPAERDLLAAMPLLPRDLMAYQLASVTVTTLLKACLFALLLLPDLRCLPLGLLGLVAALLALELLRIAIDITAWGMSRRAFLAYRAVIIAALVIGGLAVGAVIIREHAFGRINPGEGLLDRLLTILLHLHDSIFSHVALPSRTLVDLIVADSITAANAGLAVAVFATLTALGTAIIGLYTMTIERVVRREKRGYKPSANPSRPTSEFQTISTSNAAPRRIRRHIPRCGGAGPLLWRQLVGARRHWGSLLTAMIAPAVLACAPSFVIANNHIAFLSTTATLAFYTFLLLPTALRFDFRRDLDRLAILKGLPIQPAAAAIGQTLAPVLIATVFQAVVLSAVTCARSLPPHGLAAAMLVMIPLNMLVFALDNLIYLLYPHRVQQEGLEIFLRTMLTFTGKGLLFAAGLAVMAAWGFTAAALTRALSAHTGIRLDAYAVFAAGMIAGPAVLAALVLCGLARTYRRMDPIEDVPR
jgi:hypothetical protein